MRENSTPEPICSICDEPVTPSDNAVVTAVSMLHVECVEQSAAAA